MKKYLSGMLAMLLALAFSVFTKPAKSAESPKRSYFYWFEVKPGYGDLEILNDDMVTFMSGGFTAPSASCSGAGFNCVVGFDITQLYGPANDKHIDGFQPIADYGHLRSSL